MCNFIKNYQNLMPLRWGNKFNPRCSLDGSFAYAKKEFKRKTLFYKEFDFSTPVSSLLQITPCWGGCEADMTRGIFVKWNSSGFCFVKTLLRGAAQKRWILRRRGRCGGVWRSLKRFVLVKSLNPSEVWVNFVSSFINYLTICRKLLITYSSI